MSTQIHEDGDPWQIYVRDLADQSKVAVWCGNAQDHDSEDLTPAQARRMAQQLIRAAGPEDIAPMPPYDPAPSLRVQACELALRMVLPPATARMIVDEAAVFERYLKEGWRREPGE